MNITAEAKTRATLADITEVHASELLSLLAKHHSEIKVLSLDCFDTLLWRQTYSPTDVFSALEKNPTFKAVKFSAYLRTYAESCARKKAFFKYNKKEVTLAEIYRQGLPDLDQQTIDALTEEELQTEMEYCYPFPPILELLQAAKKYGIKIIIVSDTYFSEAQLHRLLSNRISPETMQLIDHIFCSSDYSKTKASGVFDDVLAKLRCPAKSIWHLGDNKNADYTAARAFGLNSTHFIQFNECIQDKLHLQVTIDKLFRGNTSQPLANPFRGLLGLKSFSADKTGWMLGYASLGPIFYSFARFILDEISQLQNQGKKIKVAFLMRDGHLPALACETLSGKEIGKRVRISRFASFAASFQSVDDILSYIIDIGNTNRLHDLSRQLLLSDDMANKIISNANQSKHPVQEFLKLIQAPPVVKHILEKSAEYRERLLKHLECELALQAGDTLMLVDLGYTGTTQKCLAPILAQRNIELIGRYLIALETPGWEKNRVGLLDPNSADLSLLHALVYYIMVIEQCSTSNEKSVIDYTPEGQPIFTDKGLSLEQHERVEDIQSACLAFIRDMQTFLHQSRMTIPLEMLRTVTQAELGRLIFLPTENELNFLKNFKGEMNLGTKDLLTLFDTEKGLAGLRRQGVFFMETPSKDSRVNYPYELRTAGIDYALSLLVQHRFSLDINFKDMLHRREQLTLTFINENERFNTQASAVATFDGYYSLLLPGKLNSVLHIGKHYKWLELESAEFVEMQALSKQHASNAAVDALPYLSFENMTQKDGMLYECNSEQSCIRVTPLQVKDNTINYVLRLVFRPIVRR